MASIVLGIGSSHTPMLNAPVEDWPRFIELDRPRPHLDKLGRPVNYQELLSKAEDRIASELAPEKLSKRWRDAMDQVEHLGHVLLGAALDALIVVGDDQKELYQADNLPAILLYHGKTIPNVPLKGRPGPRPPWAHAASSRYYEPEITKLYPVHAELALHLVDHLVDHDFDVAVADQLPEGMGEGHAFGFVHRRLLNGAELPVVPVFLNTYYPPNQPTPRRCHALGRQIRAAVECWPANARVGILASGGLSHFTVDEELDGRVIRALRERDALALCQLPRELLNSGNSEIRNWICMAGATEHLDLQSLAYLPGYRTPAGTGTGMCFGVWS